MKNKNEVETSAANIETTEPLDRREVYPEVNVSNKLYYYLGMLEDIIENEDFTDNTYAKNVKIGAIKSYFDLHYKLIELQLKRETLEAYKQENKEVSIDDLIKDIIEG